MKSFNPKVEEYIQHVNLLNDERNNFQYWYPKVLELDIPTPKAEIITLDRWDVDQMGIYRWIYHGFPKSLERELKRRAKSIGYPLFMRTDKFSGKHYYSETCFVEDEDSLIYNLRNLIESAILRDLTTTAIVLREYVELDWSFKAFLGQLPIAPEVRYFIKDGEILCSHFYWTEDAIEHANREDWKWILKLLEELTKDEAERHCELAEKVASKFEGYWSVDFARTRRGEWILIDMAIGEVSWHPKCTEINQ